MPLNAHSPCAITWYNSSLFHRSRHLALATRSRAVLEGRGTRKLRSPSSTTLSCRLIRSGGENLKYSTVRRPGAGRAGRHSVKTSRSCTSRRSCTRLSKEAAVSPAARCALTQQSEDPRALNRTPIAPLFPITPITPRGSVAVAISESVPAVAAVANTATNTPPICLFATRTYWTVVPCSSFSDPSITDTHWAPRWVSSMRAEATEVSVSCSPRT
mmetsp:Transcript_15259/g.36167  ORF Transcript_15259/g.36167 Transcript_15259/m.36167 type:complete len:215 (-) Transcript_15259:391-1035(-)